MGLAKSMGKKRRARAEEVEERWGGAAPAPGESFQGAPLLKTKDWLHCDPHEEAEGIISIQGVLSADECRGLVRAAEGGGMTLQTSRGPKFGEAHRHHQRTSYDDSSFAQQLWDTGLSAAAAELRADDDRKPVGLNPNIRIYSYSPGDLFGPHYDDYNTMADGARTEFTLLLYLTGSAQGLVGGETTFYGPQGGELLRVAPEAGSALLHRHGAACLLH